MESAVMFIPRSIIKAEVILPASHPEFVSGLCPIQSGALSPMQWLRPHCAVGTALLIAYGVDTVWIEGI